MSINNKVNDFLANSLSIKVEKLKAGTGVENNRYKYQQKFIDFPTKKGDKILDIGSGGYPFPLATHLADLYPKSTTHRTEELIKDERPFIVCDILDLPFKDKEFDFIYCSHVLEHVDDPAKACSELIRTSKAGYIETPTKTSDIMLNFLKVKNHHKWFIVMSGNSLVFFEYNQKERHDTGVSDFYNMLHSKHSNPFQGLVTNNHNLFDNMFLWKGSFNYLVFNKDGKLLSTNQK